MARILIADDNETVRNMERSFFQSQRDFEICGEAINGLDAVEKASQLHPDLVVLDLSMPVMNGLEAAFRLKKMMPGMPIILYTLYEGAIRESDARAAGISAVIPKGDGMENLVREARTLLKLVGPTGAANQGN
ncbi:MAG: response regulator transcription factor [Candidatus Acidiferrales bacterium]